MFLLVHDYYVNALLWLGNSQKIKYPLEDVLNDSDALHYRSAHPIKVEFIIAYYLSF